MNWQHLTYFLTTAEVQNFTQAAEQLYVTPSTLSKAIRNLENELGFPLFEKQGRNVMLTSYGTTFYQYVAMAASDLAGGLTAVQRQMGFQSGHIHLSGIYTMCADYLPPRIKAFKQLRPDATFTLEYQITSKILADITDGNCDLGFCGDYEVDFEEYVNVERILLKIEDLVIAASKDHWLAEKPYVELEELKEEPFIIYRNVNSGISYNFWPLFQNTGFMPRVAFEVTDDHSILGLVAAGLGIALVADNPALQSKGVIIRHLKGLNPTRNQYMIWRKDRFMSGTAQKFRDFILDSIENEDLKL